MENNVKKLIREEIEIAEKRLRAAEVLLEKDMLEDAINRIYYSIYYAAKAMPNVRGFDAKTHSSLISEFGLRLVKEGLVEEKYGRILRNAFEKRETSDYQIGVVFGREEVVELLKAAKEFLRKAKKFVKKNL